jgi:hypothetical protein
VLTSRIVARFWRTTVWMQRSSSTSASPCGFGVPSPTSRAQSPGLVPATGTGHRFGIQEPTPTWGNMLAFAQSYMFQHPWLPLIPTLPILVCSLAVNYLGDGLRDVLDPRQRR